MTTLCVSPYRQADYWGRTSLGLVKLLSEQCDDLAIRPLYYNQSSANVTGFETQESNRLTSKDVLIQVGLPFTLNPNFGFKKNIAVTMVDSNIKSTGWTTNLNLFDDILVFTDKEKRLLEESGITSRIHNFMAPPIAGRAGIANINIPIRDKFVFYTDCSIDDKSGLEELLTAYLSAFATGDNKIMALFCSPESQQGVNQLIDKVKTELGIYRDIKKYQDIILIPNNNDDVLNYAHANFDCFVNVSYDAGVNYQTAQAFGFGRACILLDTFKDTIEDYPLLVEGSKEVCVTKQRPFPGLFSGENSWVKPSTFSLREKMKEVTKDIADAASQKIIGFNSKITENQKEVIKGLLCTQ